MKEKVFIEIKKGHYDKSVKSGKEYISVEFSGRNYGAGYPCDNEEEVKKAIKSQSEWIRRERDIPMVRDLRIKQTTL